VYKESSDFMISKFHGEENNTNICIIYVFASCLLEKKRDFLKISPIIFTEESLCYTRKGKIYF